MTSHVNPVTVLGARFPELPDAVREIERSVGLKPGFLDTVYEDLTDWSFVVKVHALLDAALAHLIVEGLGKPELSDVIGFISFDGRIGKMVLAEKLQLLEPPSLAFLRRINSIRNRFSHDVKSIDLRIEDIVNEKPPNAENVWRDLAHGFMGESGGDTLTLENGDSINLLDFAARNPRRMIWLAAMNTIGLIYYSRTVTLQSREWSKRMASLGNVLVREAFLELGRASGSTAAESDKATNS